MWVDYAAVQAYIVGTCQEWAHAQLIRNNSATVILAHWAAVDWSWPKSGISVHNLISTYKKKTTGMEWIVEHSPKILARKEKATTIVDIRYAKIIVV